METKDITFIIVTFHSDNVIFECLKSLPKDSNIKIESGCLLVSVRKGSQKININDKLFSYKTNDKNEFQITPNKKTRKTSILWGS